MIQKISSDKKGRRLAQAAMEYFIIFTSIAALTLLSVSFFFPKVKQTITDFYKKTALAITGTEVIVVPPVETTTIEVQHDFPGGGNAYSGELAIPTYGACSTTVPFLYSLDCWNKYTGNTINTNTAEWCAMWGICSVVGASGRYTSRWRIRGYPDWNGFILNI